MKPPSTRMSVPVTKLLALGHARKTQAPINSCAWPKRPMGVWPQIDFVRAVGEPSSWKSSLRFCSAGKKPGVMVFTRTPWEDHSRASKCESSTTAEIDTEYLPDALHANAPD